MTAAPESTLSGPRASKPGDLAALLCPAWLTDRPMLADTLLALVLAAATAAMVTNLGAALDESVLASPSGLPDWLILFGPVFFVPFRRVSPTLAVIGGGAAQAIMWLANLQDNYITMTVLLYSAAAVAGGRSQRAAWWVTVALTSFTLCGVLFVDVPFYALPLVALSSVAAVVIGTNITRREAYTEAMEARMVDAQRSRRAERERAISEERNRIARELHDVVAHGLAVMVVQAGAAQRTLDRNPAAAHDALQRIEETGRTALGEMRHVLSAVRTDPDESWRPAPGLAGLDELIDDLATTGLDVSLLDRRAVVEQAPDGGGELRRELPATVDLTAYRIVQESLTNVLKHGGRNVTASVEITDSSNALALSIVDNGNGASSEDLGGYGLRGIEERVAVFGGDFSAGPRRGGGFAVHVSLPLDEPGRLS